MALDLSVYDENQHLEKWFRPLVNKSPAALLGEMSKIVTAYHNLKDFEKKEVIEAFENNQNIKEICKGNGNPKKYNHISNEAFRLLIDNFFASLWLRLANKEDGVNAKVIEKCSTIMSHFSDFRKHPNHITRICPFCGLNGLKPSFSPTRNSYDHYLPKAQYPFVSVNFENLVPMCHDCNSDEKGTDDTPFNGNVRRIVYYPYCDSFSDEHLDVVLSPKSEYKPDGYSTFLKDVGVDYYFTSNGIDDNRLKSWDSIFRVKGRYIEIVSDYESIWFQDLLSEYQTLKETGRTFVEIKDKLIKDMQKEVVRTERAIVHLSYLKYVLNIEDIEEDLDSV
ncbi:hypothetical protein HNS38_16630 [Lentimicrobium sp. L6]|uniref:HNH endonuclease n=1 Tax=Lentimicrobium sp. L6 TaxID=2735916 RepID=UPI001552C9AE|nr:hypothetical protein [Lentimicrobium sp. L6]NPD86400.1 hypothetical protein [Lentimicrobium sp. L6]